MLSGVVGGLLVCVCVCVCVCVRACVRALCVHACSTFVSSRCSSRITARLPWQLESGWVGVGWQTLISKVTHWQLSFRSDSHILPIKNLTLFTPAEVVLLQWSQNNPNLYPDITTLELKCMPPLSTLSSNIGSSLFSHHINDCIKNEAQPLRSKGNNNTNKHLL